MSLEVALLVPVLMLLTLFVLWAGRGGKVALAAELAAEEAATAVALCCPEDTEGEQGREAVAQEMLTSRPGLDYLCIDGIQPGIEQSGQSAEFVREHWLPFEPGSNSGGVGMLEVRFSCETDGAVAPLRGLFPTVSFEGQAAEVVTRHARPLGIGFKDSRVSVKEGVDLVFVVQAAGPVAQDIDVSYVVDTLETTATAGADYDATGLTGTVTILAGTSEAQITVETVPDGAYEGDELLVLDLTAVSIGNVTLDPDRERSTGEITDDTPQPWLAIECPGPQAREGESLTFKVRLRNADDNESAPAADDIYVLVSTGGGTATATNDFDPFTNQQLVFSASAREVSQNVTVTTRDDSEAEETETVELVLGQDQSNPWPGYFGGTLGASCPRGTAGKILDDEAVLSVEAAQAEEGQPLTFKLTLTERVPGHLPELDVVVDYELHQSRDPWPQANGGNSCSTADYLWVEQDGSPGTFLTTGTLTILPGTTTAEIVVSTCEDDLVEHDETFWLQVSVSDGEAIVPVPPDPGGYGPDGYGAHGTILNDDFAVVTVDSADASETDGVMTFNVSLKVNGSSARIHQDVTVDFRTLDDEARGGSACNPGVDYVSLPTQTLTFTPSMLDDPNTPDADESAHQIEVEICDDTDWETDETFWLEFSSPSPFSDLFDGDPDTDDPTTLRAAGTITNVDPPTISVSAPEADEGTELVFTVTLNRPRDNQTVTVDYTVEDSAAKATRGDYAYDFTESPPPPQPLTGMLTLSDRSPTATVRVLTLPDRVPENPEEVLLVLSLRPPANAALESGGIGIGTIIDVPPGSVRVNSPRATEGDTMTFSISLRQLRDDDGNGIPKEHPFPMGDLARDIHVSYQTEDKTARGGPADDPDADYAPVSGTVMFTRGGSNALSVEVKTHEDTDGHEGEESFALRLEMDEDSLVAGLADLEGTGTISDRPPPRICIENADTVREGETAGFTVTLRDHNDGVAQGSCKGEVTTSHEPVTVDYTTRSLSATAGTDFEPRSGTLEFRADTDTTLVISVPTLSDPDWEPEEEFHVDLHSPVNATIDRAIGKGTIRTDCIDETDPEIPALALQEQQVTEGASATIWASVDRPLCFNLELEWQIVTSSEATATDTEAVPADFTQYHYFSPWSASVNSFRSADDRFRLAHFWTEDDGLDENDEVFRVLVRWDSGMPERFLDSNPWVEAEYTIIDNDSEPRVSIADGAAIAGSDMSFELELNTESGRDVIIGYYTADITAQGNGVDYTSVPNSLPQEAVIRAGTSSTTITVGTTPNTPGEPDETFHIVLASASNAAIDDGVGVGTILAQSGPSLRIDDASAPEAETMRFAVTLSEAAPHTVTVDYRSAEHVSGLFPAAPAVDYVTVQDSLTFNPGETVKFVSVAIEPDDSDEPDETFIVELSNQTAGISLADRSAIGTIEGNVDCLNLIPPSAADLPPIIGEISGPSVSGHSGSDIAVSEDAGAITLTLTFEVPFCHSHLILIEELRGTALRNSDYVLPYHDYADMTPLDPDIDIVIPIINDEHTEGDEYVELIVRGNIAAGFNKFMETLRIRFDIVDDDHTRLEIPTADTVHTSEGGYLSFTVRLDKPTAQQVTFDFETADGTATQDDYQTRSGQATIPPGELSVTIPVRTFDDGFDEHDETVRLLISNLQGAEPDPSRTSADGLILDDDAPPTVSVFNAEATEGGDLEFVVRLNTPSGRPTWVDFSTRDGVGETGATAPDDYDSRSGTLDFAVGDTEATIVVPTHSDGEGDGDELLFLDLMRDGDGGLLLDDPVGAGIIHDVSERLISIADAFVSEGGVLEFTVGFEGPPRSEDIVVDYRTTADTATPGDDYDDLFETRSGQVRILAGLTSAKVRIPTVEDRLDESAERLHLHLSNSVGAMLAGDKAVGLIVDDDPEPSLRIDDPVATESIDEAVGFTLTLSEASGRDVEVIHDSVEGTAEADDDYRATQAGGEVATIPAGDVSIRLLVPLVDDSTPESVEDFQMVLRDPVHARIADPIGVARIFDDDGAPQLLPENPEPVYEGSGASVEFVVRLSRAASEDITVNYATQADSATAGDDFVADSGTVFFAAGDTEQTVSVVLVNDDIGESDEQFRLVFSYEGTDAVVDPNADAAIATILDDDAVPRVSVDDVEAAEGAVANFTVSLDKASPRATTVRYAAVIDPTAFIDPTTGGAPATPGQDFTPVDDVLTIPALSTHATVSVPLSDDALDEHAETFWLRLREPEGARLADGTGTGTVIDDDPLPRVTIAEAGGPEGTDLQFAVSLDAISGRTVLVPWTTAPRAHGDSWTRATIGDDYTAQSGTLRFPAGITTAHITVETVDDDRHERDETFFVHLGNPINATGADSTALGTIRDNDSEPRILISDVEVVETDSPAVFIVTLSRPSSLPVTVTYQTSNGTATAPADYAISADGSSGTLSIPAGLTVGEISVFIVDDNIPEHTETFDITLSDAVNGIVATDAGTATAYILDNERTRLFISDASAFEDEGVITFDIFLEGATALDDVTVDYRTFDASATQPGDYIAQAGTATIPSGSTTATISVALTDDVVDEGVERFVLRLSNANGAHLSDDQAEGSIFDEDTPPRYSLASQPFYREDAGTVTMRVVLDRASEDEITVDYATADPKPLSCDRAMVPTSGRLIFEPGSVAEEFEVTLVDDMTNCVLPLTGFADVGPAFYRSFTINFTDPQNAISSHKYGYHWYTAEPFSYYQYTSNIRIRVLDIRVLPCVGLRNLDDIAENAGQIIITPTLSYRPDENVRVRVRAVSGSATSGEDFDALNTIVTIPAGQLSTDVTFGIVDDSEFEGAETLQLRVSAITNARDDCESDWWSNEIDVTIADDESALELSVKDIDIAEDAGTAIFEITLDQAARSDVTVNYSTDDGSATAPSDYISTSGSLRINAGRRSAFVMVPVVDNAAGNGDKTFKLLLSTPNGAVIADDEANATIRDNESQSRTTLSIADAATADSSTCLNFWLTLSEAATGEVTVHVTTVAVPSLGDRAAIPIELEGSSGEYVDNQGQLQSGLTGEYLPRRSFPVRIFRSFTSQNFCVFLAAKDSVPEFDKQFKVVIHDVEGAIVSKSSAWGTILDTDNPRAVIDDVTVAEDARSVNVTVRLLEPGVLPASLKYVTEVRGSVGDEAARPDEDYAQTSAELRIPAGNLSATITVLIHDDNRDEADESFLIQLSEGDAIEFTDSSALVTITDDDPGWWVSNATVSEGTSVMEFTVQRDHTSTAAVAVRYQVSGASATGGDAADGCADGIDFLLPSGNVVVQPAQTETTVNVTICDDTEVEARETLLFELTNVDGRNLSAVGAIIDNEN
ncbi:Calx-beta domain-containing protein [Candidatus Poriferisodalis sp.]|uniref:Calx-beta domain-containing protein n=1 Tax=Candidatus Poriferisodalis sp. TaxID=3101277 RepID=UPI003B011102